MEKEKKANKTKKTKMVKKKRDIKKIRTAKGTRMGTRVTYAHICYERKRLNWTSPHAARPPGASCGTDAELFVPRVVYDLAV